MEVVFNLCASIHRETVHFDEGRKRKAGREWRRKKEEGRKRRRRRFFSFIAISSLASLPLRLTCLLSAFLPSFLPSFLRPAWPPNCTSTGRRNRKERSTHSMLRMPDGRSHRSQIDIKIRSGKKSQDNERDPSVRPSDVFCSPGPCLPRSNVQPPPLDFFV